MGYIGVIAINTVCSIQTPGSSGQVNPGLYKLVFTQVPSESISTGHYINTLIIHPQSLTVCFLIIIIMSSKWLLSIL